MAVMVFVFVAGLGLGVWLGRRSVAGPNVGTGSTGKADTRPPVSPSTLEPVTITDKARKKGLTEESMTPSDDILERLRRAAEGDTAAIEEAGVGAVDEPQDPELTEAERRVLDRLRQQSGKQE